MANLDSQRPLLADPNQEIRGLLPPPEINARDIATLLEAAGTSWQMSCPDYGHPNFSQYPNFHKDDNGQPIPHHFLHQFPNITTDSDFNFRDPNVFDDLMKMNGQYLFQPFLALAEQIGIIDGESYFSADGEPGLREINTPSGDIKRIEPLIKIKNRLMQAFYGIGLDKYFPYHQETMQEALALILPHAYQTSDETAMIMQYGIDTRSFTLEDLLKLDALVQKLTIRN